MKRRKIKKKYRPKKRKPLFESNIISGLFLFLLFFLFILYFISFHPKVQLEKIIIINDKYVNKEVLTDFISSKTSKKIWFLKTNSMLLFSEKDLKKELLKQIPIIRDVEIKKIFPNILQLQIEERVPASIWCERKAKNTCYYIDKNGVAFQRAEFMGEKFFIVIKEKEEFIIGNTVLDNDEIETILTIREKMERFNFDISYYHIHSKEKIEIILEKGWRIKVRQATAKEELNEFYRIYESQREMFKEVENYIDLRFKDRVIIK